MLNRIYKIIIFTCVICFLVPFIYVSSVAAMATAFARHSGVQRDVLHLYAAFIRALRGKQDNRAMTEYLYLQVCSEWYALWLHLNIGTQYLQREGQVCWCKRYAYNWYIALKGQAAAQDIAASRHRWIYIILNETSMKANGKISAIHQHILTNAGSLQAFDVSGQVHSH